MAEDSDWIPTAAFIEYYVLEEAVSKDVTISKASSTVVPRFGLKHHGAFLHLETRLLGMLYTLLVFPRETWDREGLLQIVVERALRDKDLSTQNKSRLNERFLRSVRNAVSHARIEFSERNVTFRDGRDYSKPDFQETMTIQETVNLLLVLGRAFHESAQIKDRIKAAGMGTP